MSKVSDPAAQKNNKDRLLEEIMAVYCGSHAKNHKYAL
jgi:hypothetical protein